MEHEWGKYSIVLRLKNCTGNIIDLSIVNPQVNNKEIAKAQVALTIDFKFKNQRSRTIAQAIDMVVRQRTISTGYYDL